MLHNTEATKFLTVQSKAMLFHKLFMNTVLLFNTLLLTPLSGSLDSKFVIYSCHNQSLKLNKNWIFEPFLFEIDNIQQNADAIQKGL